MEESVFLMGQFLCFAKPILCASLQILIYYLHLCHLNINPQIDRVACFLGIELMQTQNIKTFCWLLVFGSYSNVLWLATLKYVTRWWRISLGFSLCTHPCLRYQKSFCMLWTIILIIFHRSQWLGLHCPLSCFWSFSLTMCTKPVIYVLIVRS